MKKISFLCVKQKLFSHPVIITIAYLACVSVLTGTYLIINYLFLSKNITQNLEQTTRAAPNNSPVGFSISATLVMGDHFLFTFGWREYPLLFVTACQPC